MCMQAAERSDDDNVETNDHKQDETETKENAVKEGSEKFGKQFEKDLKPSKNYWIMKHKWSGDCPEMI